MREDLRLFRACDKQKFLDKILAYPPDDAAGPAARVRPIEPLPHSRHTGQQSDSKAPLLP